MTESTWALSYGYEGEELFRGTYEQCQEEAILKYGFNKNQLQRLIDGDEVSGLVLSEVE